MLNTRSHLTITLITVLCLTAFCGEWESVSASSAQAGFIYKGFEKGYHILAPIHVPELQVELVTEGIVLGEDTTRFFLCTFEKLRVVDRIEGTKKYINILAKMVCKDGVGRDVEFVIRHTVYMNTR